MSSVSSSSQFLIPDFHQKVSTTVEIRRPACQTWTVDGVSYAIEDSSLRTKLRLYCLKFLSFFLNSTKNFLNNHLKSLAEEYECKSASINDFGSIFEDFFIRRAKGNVFWNQFHSSMSDLRLIKEHEKEIHGYFVWNTRRASSFPYHARAAHLQYCESLLERLREIRGKRQESCIQAQQSLAEIATLDHLAIQASIVKAYKASLPEVSVKKGVFQNDMVPFLAISEQEIDEISRRDVGGPTHEQLDALLDPQGKPVCVPNACFRHRISIPITQLKIEPIRCSTWNLDGRSYNVAKQPFSTVFSLYFLKCSAYLSASSRISLQNKLERLSREYGDNVKLLQRVLRRVKSFLAQEVQYRRKQIELECEVQAILSLKSRAEGLCSLACLVREKAPGLLSECQGSLRDDQKEGLAQMCHDPRPNLMEKDVDLLLSLLNTDQCVAAIKGSETEHSLLSSYAGSSLSLAKVEKEITSCVKKAQDLIEQLTQMDRYDLKACL